MSSPEQSVEGKLLTAAELIKGGRKKEARQLLREVLVVDQNNLFAWELLTSATLTPEEEIYCLNRILNLRPNHPWARQRLAVLSPGDPLKNPDLRLNQMTEAKPAASTPVRQPLPAHSSQPRKRQSRSAWWFAGALAASVLVGILLAGIILFNAGAFSPVHSADLTASALAGYQSSCQALIQKAMQASGNFCSRIGANQVCYGNITLQAELFPNAAQRFSERGDVVNVSLLRSLSASPLDLDKNQWGIAIFKVLANLPRSLPGELVTLMVFGNTTLEKSTQNLDAFYFSSQFGQILCQKVPFDGILINMPDGAGIHFTVNGTDLTLMGNASLNAVKNGNMQIGLYNGSGLVQADGVGQYLGAGQQVSIPLGGSNGTEAVGPPSTPGTLPPDDLNLPCVMTGQDCSPGDIHPLNTDQAQETIQAGLGTTPTITPMPSLSATPGPSPTPTSTPLPTLSVTPGPSSTSTSTPTPTLSITPGPSPTPTRTPLPTLSVTPGPSPTSTRTPTATPTLQWTATGSYTASPSQTPLLTATQTAAGSSPSPTYTASYTPTIASASTNTPLPPTATVTHTTVPTAAFACSLISVGQVTISGTTATMPITNNNSSSGTLTQLVITWVPGNGNSLDSVTLGSTSLWTTGNSSTNSSPVTISVSGTISAGSTATLTLTYKKTPATSAAGDNTIQITVNSTCQITGSN